MDEIIHILQEKNCIFETTTTREIIQKGNEIVPSGIGDLLLIGIMIKSGKIQTPVYINLFIYISNVYTIGNPTSSLLFNVNLLNKIELCEHVRFYYDTDIYYTSKWNKDYSVIQSPQLLHSYFTFHTIFEDEYIIFHTKARFVGNFSYFEFKSDLRSFFKKFKSPYKIILLGERTFPSNKEGNIHKISTIYDELLELKNHNDLIDLTKENIYDNLNLEEYINDVNLIHNAKKNIVFGHGGQYCTCFTFSKSTVVYTIPMLAQLPELPINGMLYCYDLNTFDSLIKD
jgi:hypothetical protein